MGCLSEVTWACRPWGVFHALPDSVSTEPGNVLIRAQASESPSAGERWGLGTHNIAAPSQKPARVPCDSIRGHVDAFLQQLISRIELDSVLTLCFYPRASVTWQVPAGV